MSREPSRRRYRRFFGADPRRDVDDELSFHLAMRMDEYADAGLSPHEATEQAMNRFGDVEQVRAECGELSRARHARVARGWRWEAIRQDAVYALRTLLADPGFSLVVILTLALGIGANSAVFSVAYGVLLRPLPYRDADALVRLWSKKASRNIEFFSVSPADYKVWREANVFSAIGAFERQRDVTIAGKGESQSIELSAVTPEIFAVLGTEARLGRTIGVGDVGGGAPLVAVLSYDAWTTRFGADSSLIGGDLTIDGRRHAVVGIMPPRFAVPGSSAQIWTVLSLDSASLDHGNRLLRVLARLAPGISLDRARRDMDVIAGRLAQEHPGTNVGWTVNIMAVPEMIVGTQFRRAVLLLIGVVGFVLLVACANAANLQLARATARRKEIALRSALGASRGRIAMQLLIESAVLAVAGGFAGLGLAKGGLALLRAFGSQTIPRLADVRLDGPALAFTALVTLGGGVLFGILPALRASRTDVGEVLKEGGRSSAGPIGDGVRASLVIAEISLSLMLLIGAGLLMRSFVKLQHVDIGFDPRGLYLAPVSLPQTSYPEPERVAQFSETILERARSLPGVISAAAVNSAPFAGPNPGLAFVPVDHPVAAREQAPDADYRVITPGYLQTMAIPLLHGRDFTAMDRADAPSVALVSQTLARRNWPNEDPIGRRVRIGDVIRGPEYTVVGIVGDARYQSLETPETRPMLYFSALARPPQSMTLVMRGSHPDALSRSVRALVTAIDPALPPPSVSDMQELIGFATATRRFALVLFTVFAGSALLLAVVGIYGVMSYLVRQRTHEMGIRIALGAPLDSVVSLVVGKALRLTVAGVIVGLFGAWALTRSLSSLLFGIEARDPLTFAGVAALLTAAAVLASLVPARRATRADPMLALRGP